LYPFLLCAMPHRKGGAMKVQALQDFYDKENDLKLVKKGTTLTVNAERGQKLISLGVAKEISTVAKKPDKETRKGGDPLSPAGTPG
jgi:hypothetical protein